MLAQRIGVLLADEGLRRNMGAAGRYFVQSRFTFKTQAEEYLRLFEELGIQAVLEKPKTRAAA
jgi:glycosyltransferase involved in cell wall biosynthesis